MKNLLIVLVLLVTVPQLKAQLKVGLNAGIPVGKASDNYSFSAGLDLYYIFAVSRDEVLEFGVTSGIINYFGDEVDGDGSIDDAQIIPIAVSGRVNILSALKFGADFGYGIGINIEDEGGPYLRVVFGLDLTDNLEVNAFYHLVKVIKGADFASTGLGILFTF